MHKDWRLCEIFFYASDLKSVVCCISLNLSPFIKAAPVAAIAIAFSPAAISAISQVFSLNKASSQLELSYPSIKKYLQALELAYLLKTIKNNLNSVRSQETAPKKVFSTSTNLVCHLLNIENPLQPAYMPFKGHIVENHVYNHLKKFGEVFYYNHNEKEVDFVLNMKDKIIPIEVKSKNKLRKTDFNHLIWFMKKKKINVGYLLYDGQVDCVEKEGTRIYLLPWWII